LTGIDVEIFLDIFQKPSDLSTGYEFWKIFRDVKASTWIVSSPVDALVNNWTVENGTLSYLMSFTKEEIHTTRRIHWILSTPLISTND
jgi:hypothetical protein